MRNFQAETLKLLFDTWKQSKPYSRIGIVLQNDVTFATSASELRFPKEFLKEFRGLFLLLNVGPSSVSMATLVEDMPKSSNLFRRPFVTERSNINTERTGKTPTKGLVPGSLDKRAMKYRGDPWLAPVCSYECQPLVQLLYQTHLFLLRRFHMDLNFRFLASYIFLFYALTFCLLCIFLYFILR